MAVDGNAIGGLLNELFGGEMTMAGSVCASCGDHAHLAELVVYMQGPGTVVRCRSCHNTLMVVVVVRGLMCVDGCGLASLAPPAGA